MQSKKIFTLLFILTWVVSVQVLAVTVTFSPTQPAIDTDDVSNLVGADRDRDNVGTSTSDGAANDGSTYIAHDRNGKGQTFTTPDQAGSYLINAVTVRHCGYSDPPNTQSTWYQTVAGSELVFRLTDPVFKNTDGFVLNSETYEITGDEDNIISLGSVSNSRAGTGTWITATFDNPMLLAPGKTFGFDVTTVHNSGATFMELHGIKNTATGGNPYADGTAYSTGSTGVPGNNLSVDPGDRVFIVNLTKIYSAWNPYPGPGDDNIDTDANLELSWGTGMDPNAPGEANPDVKAHYLFGNFTDTTDPNLYLIATIPAGDPVQAAASYTLQGQYAVERDKTYKWRVVEGLGDGLGGVLGPNDPNNPFGPVWTFNTELSIPDIDAETPADQVLFPDDPAVFTVDATNPFTGDGSGMTYQWYKDGEIMTGEQNPTLSISAAGDSDEAEYYCVVTLTSNSETNQSRTAVLKLKKLLAHWAFDGDATDSANGYDGTLSGDPTYDSAGVFGDAIVLDGTEDAVTLPEGFADFSTGLTISLWAKPSAAADNARFIDLGLGAPSENIFFTRVGTTRTLQYLVEHQLVSGGNVDAEDALTLDEWQMFVVVHDPETTIATIYKNGVAVASAGVAIPNNIVRTMNYIGKSNWEDDELYAGQLDDVRIYNYPISEDEIAAMYAGSQGNYCRYRPAFDFSGPDGEPDCRVNLYDFAEIASSWMQCGFYPSCQ